MGLRMRYALTLALGGLCCVLGASAQTDRDRGKAAAQSVLDKWGSDQQLNDAAMEPLSTRRPMSTIDTSKSFSSQVACSGSQKFLRLTLLPTANNDIGQFAVDLDSNLDGTADQHTMMTGPYAAACANGMVKCPSGTSAPCNYFQWKASGAAVTLSATRADGRPVGQADLGGCYCFNSACGSGLLTANSKKVLDDMGTGIAVALQDTQPRLSMSSSKAVDALTADFYGQIGGCGADSQPEQYYKNTGGMAPAGQTIASNPDSTYAKILASPAATGHTAAEQSCGIDRTFAFTSYWNPNVVTTSFSHDGKVTSCGTGCYRITIGRTGDNYLSASCGFHTDTAFIKVNNPELIVSATVSSAQYDDWERLKLNNTIVWNTDPGWTAAGGRCDVNDDRTRGDDVFPGVDVTSYFKGTPAGGTLEALLEIAWDDKGEGFVRIDVQTAEDCNISGESVDNRCTVQETDGGCRLRDETIDGVTTTRGFGATGDAPPSPSTKTLSYGSCRKTVSRDYFEKRRTYVCQTSDSPYSGDDAKRRYNAVHGSLNSGSGDYTDETKDGSGWTTSAGHFTPMPPDPVESCVRMCKTAKPRPGVAMPEGGAVNDRNNTGPAIDYTYRTCDAGDVCPAQAGETVVEACDCRNNFAAAAAMMQTIRQTQEDMLCTAP